MSDTPIVGSGDWTDPVDTRTISDLIDHFQAQTIVRNQDVEDLTRIVNVLRDTQEKFNSTQLTSAEVLSIIAEFKSDEIKNKHPDEITQTALSNVVKKFEEEASNK
jgi:Mg-chelatase subunit ChlI